MWCVCVWSYPIHLKLGGEYLIFKYKSLGYTGGVAENWSFGFFNMLMHACIAVDADLQIFMH